MIFNSIWIYINIILIASTDQTMISTGRFFYDHKNKSG